MRSCTLKANYSIITRVGGVWGADVHSREGAEAERSLPRRPTRPVLKLLSFIVSMDLFSELHGVSISLLDGFTVRWFPGFH